MVELAEQQRGLPLGRFALADVARDQRNADDPAIAFLTGEIVTETSTDRPFLPVRALSKCAIRSPSSSAVNRSGQSSGSAPGSSVVMDWPIVVDGGIAVKPFGTGVPARDNAVQVAADNGVLR